MKLWTAFYAIQPRTVESVTNLFFPMRGGVATTKTPVEGAQRSADFLVELNDDQFSDVYDCAIAPSALSFTLMSKDELQRFTKLHVPAFRSVMEHQVLRWILPSPKTATSRYASKFDLALMLRKDFFEKKGFNEPEAAANNLIGLVSKCVFDDVRQFAPKFKPPYDTYPTIVIKDPSTDKLREIEEVEYMKRFRVNWAWFSLAKMVALYTAYNLKESFMAPFNDPDFQVSQPTLLITEIVLVLIQSSAS